ncbi:ChuX/HutX family heme-like substrate-binding protein [Gordonia aurantiaca]|uniref:heme transporter n=1 Tax=Gordonia sp. B21 TaxID=3151852 RepID=UPI003266E633
MTDPAEHPNPPSDLETLLRTPGFDESTVIDDIAAIATRLPTLGQVVGVTVAGPVIMNAVGVHATPVRVGDPLRIGTDEIVLRLNPSRLSSTLLTDPSAQVPPTLRLFDLHGNTSHATYLTDDSDRMAFESLAATARPFDDTTGLRPVPDELDVLPTFSRMVGVEQHTWFGADSRHDADCGDQVGMFDSILTDGGVSRRMALAAGRARGVRVDARRVVAALEHAALLGMIATAATAAPGCIQMRQGRLHGAREHRGQMVLASGESRVMINFNHVTECWVTWSQGPWGETAAIELYDRASRCCLVLTHAGAVARATFDAWDHLTGDLVG